MDLLRKACFGALRVPRAQGGFGASLREFFATLMDLAAANSDVAHILRAHFWFVEERLRSPDEKQRDYWLARIVAGELFGNAMSELGGSDAVGSWAFRTTLKPEGDDYVLDGDKYYCTGTLFSDWVNVFAVLPDGQLASACIPVSRSGVELVDDWDGIGQRYTGSGTVFFRHVVVYPHEVLISAVETADVAIEVKSGDPYLIGQFLQLIITAIIAGVLRNVVGDATDLLRSRKRSYSHATNASPSSDPLLLTVMGDISATAFAAEAVVLAAADAQEAALVAHASGLDSFAAAHHGSVVTAQAKIIVDDLALRAANRLFEVGGSAAVKASRGFDRHWRNIRTLASHNPTIYKAHGVGDWLVNGTELPNSGFF